MKIVTILGARPQFVKAGSVSREIIKRQAKSAELAEVIVHTGQHYDNNMSRIFFDELKIPRPNYNLGIGGVAQGAMTGQMIEGIEEILLQEQPHWVLVYGDTNSTLAGAIAASKLHLKIAHVEAGLRSFNIHMPEEINRILTDRISRRLFCPTEIAVENLENEGVGKWGADARVVLSGDVMLDSAIFYKNLAQKPDEVDISESFILCTIHRSENTDNPDRIGGIFSALNEIASNKQVIIPIHPRTRKILEQGSCSTSNLTLTNPVGYLNMIWLIDHCDLVMTDSGGLQKEAFFFKRPCITMRDETEWVELVDHGFNKVVGTGKSDILDTYYNGKFSQNFNIELYGCGKASSVIVDSLLDDADSRSDL
ncbi:MAG: non-hydrolyzing UDP-N-acetylglucosamine 2-epimerase [bacterium]